MSHCEVPWKKVLVEGQLWNGIVGPCCADMISPSALSRRTALKGSGRCRNKACRIAGSEKKDSIEDRMLTPLGSDHCCCCCCGPSVVSRDPRDRIDNHLPNCHKRHEVDKSTTLFTNERALETAVPVLKVPGLAEANGIWGRLGCEIPQAIFPRGALALNGMGHYVLDRTTKAGGTVAQSVQTSEAEVAAKDLADRARKRARKESKKETRDLSVLSAVAESPRGSVGSDDVPMLAFNAKIAEASSESLTHLYASQPVEGGGAADDAEGADMTCCDLALSDERMVEGEADVLESIDPDVADFRDLTKAYIAHSMRMCLGTWSKVASDLVIYMQDLRRNSFGSCKGDSPSGEDVIRCRSIIHICVSLDDLWFFF